ncbi:5-formyltetrahydrofolate cyclo-ligase [Cytobacillus kochii]|uniref:5-formyltetrahydrofolate cyclo-ligase n=1 Tax=Cytobacillus kochii TaxID=859143 RepID=UPI00247FE2B2|nr:5-formyltetrahydrofolate cyclo-ligase [Cytobacillus kochii]
MVDKKQLRKMIMQQLTEMPSEQYTSHSEKLASQLFLTSHWQQSKVVALTISRFPEVDTFPIINKAWSEGKQVAIPKCLPKTREMDFRIFSSYDNLEVVYSGLQEPVVDKTKSVRPCEIDLLIVPGVAYTLKGDRIGFGGGYYDRYLVDYNGFTLSLAFQEQVVNNIPIDHHDLPVQKIITIME